MGCFRPAQCRRTEWWKAWAWLLRGGWGQGGRRETRTWRRRPGQEAPRGGLVGARCVPSDCSGTRATGRWAEGKEEVWVASRGLSLPFTPGSASLPLPCCLLPRRPPSGPGRGPSPREGERREGRPGQHPWESQKTHTAVILPQVWHLCFWLPATGTDHLELVSVFGLGMSLRRQECSQEVTTM